MVRNTSNNITTISSLNREETFVVENSVETTTQRFPGVPQNVGPINEDALFHNELIQRRELINGIITPDLTEHINNSPLDVPTTISSTVDGLNFLRRSLNDNLYFFRLDSFPIDINPSEVSLISSQFNNALTSGMREAISSIRRQELCNLNAVRASMQRSLDQIRSEGSQVLPVTINENMNISQPLVENNDFLTHFFRLLGNDFIEFSLNVFTNSGHAQRIILLILILKLIAFSIVKFNYFRFLNRRNPSQVFDFIFNHLNRGRFQPINLTINLNRVVQISTDAINLIQNSLAETMARTNNIISTTRNRYNLNNLLHYILNNPFLNFLTLGGIGVVFLTSTYRMITNGTLSNTANSMNININYPETNNELSTLLSQTLTAIGAKFKAVLKELINKVKN